MLVHVREADEWIGGHVAGATHLPLAELGAHLADLPADSEILLVCRSGRRSASAAILTRCGLRATNVSGGMLAWEESGLPVVTPGAASGPVPPRSVDVGTTMVDP